MSYLKMAQRNLWRNKRRTVITVSSIFFATLFAVVMRSFQLGSYSLMIRNSIEQYYGFIRIQHSGYTQDPVLENTFESNRELLDKIQNISNVKAVTPRLETFSLASSGNISKGVLVLGIDPETETRFSNPENFLIRFKLTPKVIESLSRDSFLYPLLEVISKHRDAVFADKFELREIFADDPISHSKLRKILELSEVEGRFLSSNDRGVVLSSRLARFLKLEVGDSVILMGQGYQGASAVGVYPIVGIVKIPNPELDNRVVYMPLNLAQEFTNVLNRISYFAINLNNTSDNQLRITADSIKAIVTESYLDVKTWQELNRVLVQQIESDNQSGNAFLFLLYLVVFFGILGTVIMMVHERIHEFGVLISLGMQKHKLIFSLFLELVLMALMGIGFGFLVGIPIIQYYSFYPIRLSGDLANMMTEMGFEPLLPMAPVSGFVWGQGIVTLIMVMIASLYPIRKIIKLQVVSALKR